MNINSDNVATLSTADITKALRKWESRYETSATKARGLGAVSQNASAARVALHMVMFLRSELADRARRAVTA